MIEAIQRSHNLNKSKCDKKAISRGYPLINEYIKNLPPSNSIQRL